MANWLKAACHYRLVFRDIASSTNERTGIFDGAPTQEEVAQQEEAAQEVGRRPLTRRRNRAEDGSGVAYG
jgi:hypothetical protein